MEFRILGRLEVVEQGRELAPRRAKQRVLLAALLLRANEAVPTDQLVDALWGEAPPGTAAKALQGHVSALRKLLGPARIETQRDGYLLRLEPGELDLERFEALVTAARRVRDPDERAARLREALGLWRGEPLADFRYDAFAQTEIARLDEVHLGVLEERIDADLEAGRHLELLPELERLVSAHPLRERLRGQRMLALYWAGRQADALRVYQEGRRLLAEELGIDPGAALKTLEAQILAQDPALDPPRRTKPVPPRQERKRVTVVVAELVSGGPLDPEDLQALVEPALHEARAVLERFGGTVQPLFANALLGVFGAPRAHEDDAERAVRAALALRDAFADGALELRAGVDTGEALVTVDGGRVEVTGDVLAAASRLQAAAPLQGVLVGDGAYSTTRDAIEYEGETRDLAVEGRAEPLPVRGAVDARSRFGTGVLEPPSTPLIGRERELAVLAGTFMRARDERSPQLVTIVGVPGIGKTRLVYELFAEIGRDTELTYWRQGRSLPYGDGVTFWALGEMIKGQAGILETDPTEDVERKLAAAVESLVADAADTRRIVDHLRPLMGLASESHVSGDRRSEAFAAWRRLLEALAEHRPLVLVFEDLQWADDGLLDFIDYLVDWTSDVAMLVVCTARPELLERRPDWGGGKLDATTLSLSPLSDGETERLLSGLLGQPEADSGAHRMLLERAGGNPLYAEQLAQMLNETEGAAEWAVPESVQGVIAARLDVLAPEEKDVLQDASVLGNVFWIGGLVEGRSRPDSEERLHALERKGFVQRVRRSSVAGETEYTFRHVLVRDVAYGQIPRAARAEKHRRAAEWIEALGRSGDHAEMLAHHYLAALEFARGASQATEALERSARIALREAGDRALALHGFAAAERFYTEALARWPEGDDERPRLVLSLGKAQQRLQRGEDALTEAAKELVALGDREGAAEAELLLSILTYHQGRRDDADRHMAEAEALVDGAPPSHIVARVLSRRSGVEMGAGRFDDAITVGRQALAMADELGLDDVRASALNNIGVARVRLADPQGFADLERSVEIAAAADSPEVIRSYVNLAAALVWRGDVEEASRVYENGLRLGERFGSIEQLQFLRIEYRGLEFQRGNWIEALALADEVIGGERHYLRWSAYGIRSCIRLARGDVDGAVDDALRALVVAREVKGPEALCAALADGAFVLLAAGRPAEARALAEELLALEPVRHPGERVIFHLAWVLKALGRGDELAAQLGRVRWETRLVAAGKALLTGQLARAAEIYGEGGLRYCEAYTRLRAAEAGDPDADLDAAIDFFSRVRATAYLAEAERLLGGVTRRQADRARRHDDRASGPRLAQAPRGPLPARKLEPSDSPFVGRDDELALLERTCARAHRERSAQLVTIAGEPGAGKTRLIGELGARLEASGAPHAWREGRCLPYGDGVTYWALGEVVKAEAGILESDEPDESARKLAAALAALVPEEDARAWLEASLAPLVGMEATAASPDRQQSFAAWRELLERIAWREPLVLVFEDVHWADEALLEFVDHVVERATAPLLVVCTTRLELLEQRPDWGGGKRNATTITLAPLTDDDTERLLGALLGREVSAEEIKRAGGNPLFAHELARMAEAAPEGEGQVPASIHALIAARLDTLAPELKTLAADAAVVGEVFWSGALASMSRLEEREVEERLQRLVANEFVRRVRNSSVRAQSEFAFLHALVKDVAYSHIPRRERARKHEAAAEWIERLAGGRIADHAEFLAHHYGAALELTRAAGPIENIRELEAKTRRFLVLAGDRAMWLDLAAAERFYARALELFSADDDDRLPVLLALARTAQEAGRLREALRLYEQALPDLREHGDPFTLGRALVDYELALWRQGKEVRGQWALEAVEVLEREAPGPELVSAYNFVARQHMLAGRPEESLAWLAKAFPLAARLDLGPAIVRVLLTRGVARADLDDPGGLDDLREALRLGLELGAGLETAIAYNNLADYVSLAEGPGSSIELFDEGIEFAERRGLEHYVYWLRQSKLAHLFDLGHWDELTALADKIRAWQRLTDETQIMAGTAIHKAAVLVRRGAVADARSLVSPLLEPARSLGDPQVLAKVLAYAALVEHESGDAASAIRLVEEFEASTFGRAPTQWALFAPDIARVCASIGATEVARRLVTDLNSALAEYRLLSARAVLAEAERNPDEALAGYTDAAARWHEFGNVVEEAYALLGRGRCLVVLARHKEAAEPLAASREIFEQLDARPLVAEVDEQLARAAATV